MFTFNGRLACLTGAALIAFGAAMPAAQAQDTSSSTTTTTTTSGSLSMNAPIVGGAPMYPTKNIVQNASKSKDHTTLVTAVKAAGLVKTLEGSGPFTVFAPTNEAFGKLPDGTVATLLKPENKGKLTSILTYHVVSGHLTAADIQAKADANNGKAVLKTVEGDDITLMKDTDGKWWVEDANGGKAQITQADVLQSNGVIFVIDTVLTPKS